MNARDISRAFFIKPANITGKAGGLIILIVWRSRIFRLRSPVFLGADFA
jgi:hypothetical protein